MTGVFLTGELVCRDESELAVVAEHAPLHAQLTRAEAGCISFEMTQTADPLVWRLNEHFRDTEAFEAHQARIRESQWGAATAGIERRYTVEGL